VFQKHPTSVTFQILFLKFRFTTVNENTLFYNFGSTRLKWVNLKPTSLRYMGKDKKFREYKLTNQNPFIGYPYAGVSRKSEKIFLLGDGLIDIQVMDTKRNPEFAADYTLTDDSFRFDINLLDKMIKEYSGKRNYSLSIWLDSEKKIEIEYGKPGKEPDDVEDISDHPKYKRKSRKIASAIHTLVEPVRVKFGY
jgi:hypothetical protein